MCVLRHRKCMWDYVLLPHGRKHNMRVYFMAVFFYFSGSTDSLDERETGRTTPRLTPPRKESTGAPYRSIRFGFRQGNIVRPASVGLKPTDTTYETASNNNDLGKFAL